MNSWLQPHSSGQGTRYNAVNIPREAVLLSNRNRKRDRAVSSRDQDGQSAQLSQEEHIEQAFFFRTLRERLEYSLPMQEILASLKEEVLSTTKLPMAIDFLLNELIHQGVIGTAMERLSHYFTAYQTLIVTEAENDRGRFDLRTGLEILHREARYRGEGCRPQGVFLYQFESLCRNRLPYDLGLGAMAADPMYDSNWRDWLLTVRRQIGLVDLADMIYVRSEHYGTRRRGGGAATAQPAAVHLFGAGEGKIALANRKKDPLMLFSALQRQLGYPKVPRPRQVDQNHELLPQLARRIERLETRLKLMEDEQRGGIDLTEFYRQSGAESAEN